MPVRPPNGRVEVYGIVGAYQPIPGTRVRVMQQAALVALLIMTARAGALGQTALTHDEPHTLHWGSAVVWLRPSDSGAVLLFASAGYRSAFVQPVVLDPDEAERLAALLERFAAANDGSAGSGGSPVRNAGWSAGDSAPIVLAAGNVVLGLPTQPGAPLRVAVRTGQGYPVSTTIFRDGALAGAAVLRDVSRTARDRGTRLQVARAAAAAETTATHADAESVAVVPPAPHPTSVSAPTGDDAFARVQATPSIDAVAAHSINARPLTAPTPHLAAGEEIHSKSLASVRTRTTVASFHIATTTSAPHLAAARIANHSIPLGAAPPPGAIDDEMVQNLAHQWTPDLMYCYTQFGLREHPTLAGRVVIRFALSPDGTVGHSFVAEHAWRGEGSAPVESCLLKRVASWRFPASSSGSVHELPLAFGQ